MFSSSSDSHPRFRSTTKFPVTRKKKKKTLPNQRCLGRLAASRRKAQSIKLLPAKLRVYKVIFEGRSHPKQTSTVLLRHGQTSFPWDPSQLAEIERREQHRSNGEQKPLPLTDRPRTLNLVDEIHSICSCAALSTVVLSCRLRTRERVKVSEHEETKSRWDAVLSTGGTTVQPSKLYALTIIAMTRF